MTIVWREDSSSRGALLKARFRFPLLRWILARLQGRRTQGKDCRQRLQRRAIQSSPLAFNIETQAATLTQS